MMSFALGLIQFWFCGYEPGGAEQHVWYLVWYYRFRSVWPLPVGWQASSAPHPLFRVHQPDVVHSIFRFYGTNAYWLQMTTDDDMQDDMDFTFHEIAKANLKVVRAWAFNLNDVPSKPSPGPYFQVLFDDIFLFLPVF
jgi:hypothetical protein